MIERYVEQVSTYAADIDNVILLIGVLVGFWFVVAEAVFIGFILKFRAKDGVKAEYIDGSNKKHKRWITIPHALVLVCDVFIVIGAVRVWVDVKQTLPPPDATVRIVAQQWAWTFVHPGPDRKLDTADDISMIDELHLEQDLTYHYELQAVDVLHDFSVPVFRLKQDAIPGRTIKGWFKATKSGEWSIQCAEMCGIGHGIMGARLHVETPEQHATWMAAHVQGRPATDAEAAPSPGSGREPPPQHEALGKPRPDAGVVGDEDAGMSPPAQRELPESNAENAAETETETKTEPAAAPGSEKTE